MPPFGPSSIPNAMKIALVIAALLLVALVSLWVLRLVDRRADLTEWKRLAALQPRRPVLFDMEMVADLPEPARRYFEYTIAPRTPLLPVVVIEMTGKFSLGNRSTEAETSRLGRRRPAPTSVPPMVERRLLLVWPPRAGGNSSGRNWTPVSASGSLAGSRAT